MKPFQSPIIKMTEERPPLLPNPIPIPDLEKALPKKNGPSNWKHQDMLQDAILDIETHPGHYTDEKVKHWKSIGLNQPEFVPDHIWRTADEDLKPIQGVICHLAAIGMPTADISHVTGKSQQFITMTLDQIPAKEEVQRVQDLVWGENFKKVLQKIVPIAVQTALGVMVDPKTKGQTKVDAAFKFIHQAMGKPTQEIKVQDDLLRRVYEELDAKNVVDLNLKKAESQVRADEIIEVVKQKTPPEVGPTDPIDAWVKENL